MEELGGRAFMLLFVWFLLFTQLSLKTTTEVVRSQIGKQNTEPSIQ